MDINTNVLSMRVDVTSANNVLRKIISRKGSNSGQYICVSNVHMCMEALDNPSFNRIVNNSFVVVPDGRPLYWAQKLMGFSDAQQVRGQDLMELVCRNSGKDNINIGFYGGSDESVLDQMIENLTAKYPDIRVCYRYSPPFRQLEEGELAAVREKITQAEVDVLFVGIGCPKQEIWMASNASQLRCTMLGVGAAFDFLSGHKSHAPLFMQSLGLEWLHRLFCEPKRLAGRYLKQNPRFIAHIILQLVFRRNYEALIGERGIYKDSGVDKA